jgi:hypothetical protein
MAPGRCVLPAAPPFADREVQTARTQELADFLEVFDRFLILREDTLDQIAAERALARLMGGDG